VPDWHMLSPSITARDRRFPTAVKDTISLRPRVVKPTRSAPRAASDANPLPQCGENGNSAEGECKPTNPMNSREAFSSAAQNPQPRSRIKDSQRSAIASLSARVSRAGKNAITLESALSAANGSRSAGVHCRKKRRSVSNSMGSGIGDGAGE
jgi:hypothetical protein